MASIVYLPFARFVNRDMFMRFRGGGIGRKSTLEWTQVFEHQSHVLPLDDDEALAVNGVDSEEEPEESEEENNDEGLESGQGKMKWVERMVKNLGMMMTLKPRAMPNSREDSQLVLH